MATFRPGTADQTAFLDALIDARPADPERRAGRLRPRRRVRAGARRRRPGSSTAPAAPDGAEVLRFPPLLPRYQLEAARLPASTSRTSPARSSASTGTRPRRTSSSSAAARHEDWSGYQTMTDLVLAAGRVLPGLPGDRRARAAGRRRHHGRRRRRLRVPPRAVGRSRPAADVPPARDRAASASRTTVVAWRDAWRDRAVELLRGLGLDADSDVASDPFFGRGGPDAGRQPARAGAQVRGARPRSPGRSRRRSPRSTTTRTTSPSTYGIDAGRRRASPTPPASGSGSSGSRSPCSAAHGLDSNAWPDEVRAGAGAA